MIDQPTYSVCTYHRDRDKVFPDLKSCPEYGLSVAESTFPRLKKFYKSYSPTSAREAVAWAIINRNHSPKITEGVTTVNRRWDLYIVSMITSHY